MRRRRPEAPPSIDRHACQSRKLGYATALDANLALLIIWKKRMESSNPVKKWEHHAYKCPRCPNWHLTSQNDDNP